MRVVSGTFYIIYILPHIFWIKMPSLTTVTNHVQMAVFILYISSLRPRYHKVGNTLMQNNAKYFRKHTEECASGKPLPRTNHNGRKHRGWKPNVCSQGLESVLLHWVQTDTAQPQIQEWWEHLRFFFLLACAFCSRNSLVPKQLWSTWINRSPLKLLKSPELGSLCWTQRTARMKPSHCWLSRSDQWRWTRRL